MHVDPPSLSPLEIDTAMKQSIVPRTVAWMLAENESTKAKGRVATDVAKLDPIGRLGVGEYVMAREVTYIEHPA